MNIRYPLLLLLLIGLPAGSYAAAIPNAFPIDGAERIVHEQLEKPVSVEFRNTRLQDAIGELSELTGIAIQAKWQPLTGAGISPNSQVSMTLNEVPARKVLQLMLDVVSTGKASTDYEAIGDDGDQYLFISTTDDMNMRVKPFRNYDLRQLIKWSGGADETVIKDFTKIVEGVVYPGIWSDQKMRTGYTLDARRGIRVMGSRNVNRSIGTLITALNDRSRNRKINPLLTGQTKAWQKADEMLHRPVTLKFDEPVTLEAFFDHLREHQELNIFAYWAELRRHGVSNTTQITVNAEKEPLVDIFDSILKQISKNPGDIELLIDEDGVFLIGTPARMAVRKQVRIYERGAQQAETDIQQIKTEIAPADWEKLGTDGSFIGQFNGMIIARTSLANHLAIQELLFGKSDAAKAAEEAKAKAQQRLDQYSPEPSTPAREIPRDIP